MTDERMKVAQGLQEKIAVLKERLVRVAQEERRYRMPEEMHERHRREIQAWLEEELARVQAEFAEL